MRRNFTYLITMFLSLCFSCAFARERDAFMQPAFLRVPVKVNDVRGATPQHRMFYIAGNNNAPADNNMGTEITKVNSRNMSLRSLTSTSGVMGIISGGSIKSSFHLTGKLLIYGGVGWGSNMANIGLRW